MKKVSIIMPTYNSEKTLHDAIQSVIYQTYPHWELLVVDDFSTDQTPKIIESFDDNRIISVRNEENLGIALSRNRGIDYATGDYIAFLDSDDLWKPEKLKRQLEFMAENKVRFSCTSYEQMDKHSNKLNKTIKTKASYDYKKLLRGNNIGCLTVVYEKEYFKAFRMTQIHHEDYFMWLQMLKSGEKAYGLPVSLAYYRIGNKSVTGNKIKSAIWTWDIYRKYEGLSLMKSAFFIVCYLVNGFKKYYWFYWIFPEFQRIIRHLRR